MCVFWEGVLVGLADWLGFLWILFVLEFLGGFGGGGGR